MYRTDHLAFRTLDREKCVQFFIDALGYKRQEKGTFPIYFDDEKKDMALCTVLEPGNRIQSGLPWIANVPFGDKFQPYSLDYELFISEGSPGSIVHDWATKRNGGGLHHIALQIPEGTTVEKEMEKWKKNGWAEDGFSTDAPIKCPELTQVFTRPSKYTGVIFELLERKEFGFCRSSVKELMLSTKGD